jgi:hypothetical protein
LVSEWEVGRELTTLADASKFLFLEVDNHADFKCLDDIQVPMAFRLQYRHSVVPFELPRWW